MHGKIEKYIEERGIKAGDIQDVIIEKIETLHEEADWHIENAISFVDELVEVLLEWGDHT